MRKIRWKGLGIGLLISIVLVPALAWATIMGSTDARQVGDDWISHITERYGSWGGAEDAYISDMEEFKGGDGLLLGYKFSIHPKGHIMVSLLSQLPPVKSYSTQYDFDVDEEGGYPALLRDTMEATLEFLENNYGPLDQLPEEGISPASNKESWDWLLGIGPRPVRDAGEPEEVIPSAVKDRVLGNGAGPAGETAGPPDYAPDYGPLVQSTWAQGYPYKNDCPWGDGGRTVVGCVATAAAQIANYWKYPRYGIGSHSYTWDGDDSCGGSTASRNVGATYSDSYDWDNMLNSYSGAYTPTEANAVSELSYEMGVAFDMDYGYCGSGAYTGDAVTVFPTYYRYADAPVKKDRADYASASAWFAEIRKEFDNPLPRPIQYRIKGHSIVCDGVRPGATDYMHLNYGWGGGSDAWYAVDNLHCPWTGCSYLVEYAVTRIQPLNRIYTYVKGASTSSIYVKYRTYYGNVQTNWETLPGGTSHAPAVAVFNNRQYMAVKGATSNAIYVNSRSQRFNWGTWTNISGGTSCSPALAVFNNRLYMAVKGATSNAIYYRSMNTNGAWTGWSSLSGGTSDSPALVRFDDRLFLFVKGATSNKIHYKWLNPNGTWGPWYTRKGSSTSHAPSAAVYDGKIFLFQKGVTSGKIYYVTTAGTSGTTWYGWSEVPGGGTTSTSPNAAVIPQTGTLSLAVKGRTGGGIYYQTYNPIDLWPGVWGNIPGSTSDTPVQRTQYFWAPWESAPAGDYSLAEAEASGQ
jgi:hypothetical protein